MKQKLTYVNTLLASAAILLGGLVYANSLGADRYIQDSREQRVRESAAADLVICARGNYQDARDKLQDQLLRDIVSVPPPGDIKERRALYAAAARQLQHRLDTQPPSVADLLERWRGNPVPDRIEREREREAAGSVARAEARDRKDRIELPVDCDELPSQRRPFSR